MLLGRWSLPDEVIAIVAAHHHPDTAAEEYRDAGRVVQAAESICNAHGLGVALEDGPAPEPSELLQSVGLEDPAIETVLDELQGITASARDFMQAA